MKIRVNGTERNVPDTVTTVSNLLTLLDVQPGKTAVEINGSIIEQCSFDTVELNAGDTVEIVSFVGGG